MNKLILSLLSFITIGVYFISPAQSSEYVMPYPSIMPGSRWHRLLDIKERLSYYWFYGDMGRTIFFMQTSDKYLIQAKTLFEYGQYKLAIQSLGKATNAANLALLYSYEVTRKNKDKGELYSLLTSQRNKHNQIIEVLMSTLPETVTWEEENSSPEILQIQVFLNEAKKTYGFKI